MTEQVPATPGTAAGRREQVLLVVSLGLVALVAFAVAGPGTPLLYAVLGSSILATAIIYRVFPRCPHFSLSFANLIGIYASIFTFFVDEVFGRVSPRAMAIGFATPLLLFVLGCWLRRDDVRKVVSEPGIRDETNLLAAGFWLVPVLGIGALVLVLSGLAEHTINTDAAFLGAMLAIGLIVLAVSRNVAMFLVEAGLLFEEFFNRMARLIVPTFAFLTFYSLLVVVFASLYTIISQHSTQLHFRLDNVPRVINFAEAIHFSIVTISTVGYGDIVPASNIARVLASIEVICGVLLLLFGVSELLEYTREHRRQRSDKGRTAHRAEPHDH